MGAGSRKNPKSRTKENGGAANEQQRKSADDVMANDIQTMGFTRTMAYNILNREDVPVVKIGSRKFIQRDKFFDWLDSREKSEIVNNDGRADR